MAEEVSPRPDPREMDMLLSTGERISCALCAMAIHDLGQRAVSMTGEQAGIVTDTSHTKARILDVRADRITRRVGRGVDRPGGGLPGRLERVRHRDHARARRLRHDRRGPGRSDRGGRVRDLHRRAGRVLGRSADRARCAQAGPGVLRGDARDGGLGRAGAPAARGRVRAPAGRADPLPLRVRGRPRYRCPLRGRIHGTTAHHRRRALPGGGARHPARRPRPPRRGRARSSARSPTRTSTST